MIKKKHLEEISYAVAQEIVEAEGLNIGLWLLDRISSL